MGVDCNRVQIRDSNQNKVKSGIDLWKRVQKCDSNRNKTSSNSQNSENKYK